MCPPLKNISADVLLRGRAGSHEIGPTTRCASVSQFTSACCKTLSVNRPCGKAARWRLNRVFLVHFPSDGAVKGVGLPAGRMPIHPIFEAFSERSQLSREQSNALSLTLFWWRGAHFKATGVTVPQRAALDDAR